MASTLVVAYFTAGCVTAVIVFVTSFRLSDERGPAARRLGLSLVAGLLWPVVLVGLAELSSVAVIAKVRDDGGDDCAQRLAVLA